LLKTRSLGFGFIQNNLKKNYFTQYARYFKYIVNPLYKRYSATYINTKLNFLDAKLFISLIGFLFQLSLKVLMCTIG